MNTHTHCRNLFASLCSLFLAGSLSASTLPEWSPPNDSLLLAPIELGAAASFESWGQGRVVAWFAPEVLPAVFSRSVAVNQDNQARHWQWIFTGPRAGITVDVRERTVVVQRQFYDSPGFQDQIGQATRHPEWQDAPVEIPFSGNLQAVTLRANPFGQVVLELNGREMTRFKWAEDFRRHQIRLPANSQPLQAELLSPAVRNVAVKVNPDARKQTMIGFGGIASATAYQALSEQGKAEWWRWILEYNLLIQREYPVGVRLNRKMDNWDRIEDAVPHYYGDNFPNGELSDFDYLRHIRRLGGEVWFEFWGFPSWIGQDDDLYADAMLDYTRRLKEETGKAPEILGIQNEVGQTTERWHNMTLTLRQRLDEEGFHDVKIHMSDATSLEGGIRRGRAFRSSDEVWETIDYSATHMYDYQKFLHNPDAYDSLLREWKETVGDKPFLSNELAINDNNWQQDSYRLALLMGQLYHKNLEITDAAAILFCWTLLNVEQPSYGWTRSLFINDDANAGMPAASSAQLRVYGAYSRRIHKGMQRIGVDHDDPHFLVTAFACDKGRTTLVALNRGIHPARLDLTWPGAEFEFKELCDPYHPNYLQPFTGSETMIPPGAIVTLSNVPLLHAPSGEK